MGRSRRVGARTMVVLGVVAALCVVLVAGVAAYAARTQPFCPHVKLISHRGVGTAKDENTIAAFEAARRDGYTEIETDMRLDRNGDFVIIHDSSVDRTTTSSGKLARMTRAQVSRLRTRGGERVPFLADILDWARASNETLLLEIKPAKRGRWNEARMRRLVSTVAEHGMAGKVTYLSYRARYLRTLKRVSPSSQTAWIARHRPSVRLAARNGDQVYVGSKTATPAFVARMDRAGVQVGGQVTQNPTKARRLADAGVSQMITDKLDPNTAGALCPALP